MRILVLNVLAMVLMLPSLVHAQSASSSTNTTQAVESGRFEIVESSAGVRNTFLLDRYVGDVWQLVTTSIGPLAWERMEVLDRVGGDDGSPRFQLFLTAHGVRNTFLIDTSTGRTWLLVTDERLGRDGRKIEVLLWQPMH